jgi:putative inorganic carbon (hco3(-)) transporter
MAAARTSVRARADRTRARLPSAAVSLAARSAILAAILACAAAGAVEAVVMQQLGVAAGLALPVGAALTVAVGRAPILGVQLALLAVPLEFFSLRVGGDAGLTASEMLLLLTAAAALARWALTGAAPTVPPPLKALALLCVLVGCGYAVAEDGLIVTKILVMWSAFVVVGVLVANAGRRDLERVLGCLAIAGGVAGLVAAAGGADQSLEAGGLIATGRAQAGFAQPNVLGFFLVMAIPAAVALSIRGRGIVRVVMAVMAAGALWGLMLSLSRTSLVGTALGLGLLLFVPAFRRVALVAIAALAVFALANFQAIQESQQVSVVTKRLATLGQAQIVESDPRLKIWETTPSIIADHPILGVGAGNFSIAARHYDVLDLENQPFDHAHDVPLTIAAELGLPGLLVFAWFAVLLARLVGRAVSARGDPALGPLLLAVAAAMVGSAVTSAGDYPPRTNVIAATFIVLVGVLWGLLRQAGLPAATPPPPSARP